MATSEASIARSISIDSNQSTEYPASEVSEYDELDLLDDPEALWNTYLKGVRLHDSNHSNKYKTKAAKQKKCQVTNQESKNVAEPKDLDSTDASTNDGGPKATAESTSETETSDVDGKVDADSERPNIEEPSKQEWNGQKKMRMRTANEVISRILWDAELAAENFTVGYLDRFSGLMEKPFQFFSWEDLASVDYDVLAVPKHRIVYFKYRDHKVWDKNERLDLIFGSTESSKQSDIRELIQQIDAEYEKKKQAFCDDCDSDDESDDIEINISLVEKPALDLCKPIRNARPNYFVAVRVTNPLIADEVVKVKKHILSKEPRLYDFMMPDGALHITLAMLRLENSAEIATAAHTIEACQETLAKFFSNPVSVQLEGLATFNSYVLYVPVIAPPVFYKLHKSLLGQLNKTGVRLAHEHDFVPHMTLLKLTKSRAKVLKSPYIDPYIYVDCKENRFGVQTCNNLQLCAIGEEKRWDGFYQCAAEVYFT